MRRSVLSVLGLVLTAVALAQQAPTYQSPVSLCVGPSPQQVFVAEETAGTVAVLDLASRQVQRRLKVPMRPRALALAGDSRLLVAGGDEKGVLAVLSLPEGRLEATVSLGHSPTALAVSRDGATAFVANRFSGTVSQVDLKGVRLMRDIPVGREPHGLALGAKDQRLLVLHHQPEGPANAEVVAIAVTVIDAQQGKVIRRVQLPNGAAVGRNLCASPDGRYAYGVHALARYQLPTTQLERGWMTTNAVSVLDFDSGSLLNTFRLDDVELGAANPWDVAVSPDGKLLAVTSAGSNEVSVIELQPLHERLAKAAKGEKVTAVTAAAKDVPNDLSFLVGIRRRHRLQGIGPRAVAFAGNLILAGEYFTDSIAVIDEAQTPLKRVASLPLVSQPVPMTPERRGEMLFNSADICFQQWQSCATCHPDGRADGLNWDLLNDGMGNPKQTKSLLLSHRTPPTMISGIRKDAETCVRAGIRYIQFAVRPDEDAKAIDAYCRAMAPAVSPFRVNGQLSEAAQRGRAVYEKAGCIACHPVNDLMTDMKSYDLGMQEPMDKGKKWDTPTIVECWRTAPYLFDGRSATMRQMLTRDNPGDVHGVTSTLTPQELDDLEAFILSW